MLVDTDDEHPKLVVALPDYNSLMFDDRPIVNAAALVALFDDRLSRYDQLILTSNKRETRSIVKHAGLITREDVTLAPCGTLSLYLAYDRR
jgi:hypothetical protein